MTTPPTAAAPLAQTAPQRPDEIAFLTGRLSERRYPSGIGLPGTGQKFATDGTVQIWPGNTFVCHVTQSTPAYEGLMTLQETMRQGPFGSFFTWLPAPSFHMTLFQGMSPGKEGSADWPNGVGTGSPRDEVSAEIERRIRDVSLPRFRVRSHGLFAGKSLTMAGIDAEAEATLRAARATLRDATRITPPDFDTYVFHITLGYLVHWLSEETARAVAAASAEAYERFAAAHDEIPLEPCAFCDFDSMHHFEPRRVL